VVRYYLTKPAAKAGVDISDITQAGGSRSNFFGRVPTAKFAGLEDIALQCGLSFRVSSNDDATSGGGADSTQADGDATATPSTVAYGLGLVTQEAWYHPEVCVSTMFAHDFQESSCVLSCSIPVPVLRRMQVNGSDSVTYHEGLGHALAMPHPQARQATCVMDLGEQLFVCLSDAAELCLPPGWLSVRQVNIRICL
jgi:hypothetical protein